MDVEPRSWQRIQQRALVAIAPQRWLRSALQGPTLRSFLLLLFVRWIIVLFWMMPAFIIALFCFAFLLPFWALWFVGAALLSGVWNIFSEKPRALQQLPLRIGEDVLWKTIRIVLIPGLWLED